MGFIILLFQSIFKFDFIKASIGFIIVEIGSVLFFETKIEVAVVKIILFLVFSFLVDRFQDSIFKWLIVLISAGLIFG